MKDESTADTTPEPVTQEAEYPQPPERVWEALTDPDALSKWLLPAADFAPEPGHRFRLDAPDGGTVEGEVREAEPARRLVYTWKASPDAPTGRVTWVLIPTERGGTRLRVVHEPVATGGVTLLRAAARLSFRRRPARLKEQPFLATPGLPPAVLFTGGETYSR
jgi:uncharacterized protein YndB with AHSA1/START domain